MAWSLVLKQLQNRSSSAAVPAALRAVATSSSSYHHHRLLNTQSNIGPAAAPPVFHGPGFNGSYNLRGFSIKSFFADACNRFSTTRKFGRLLNRIMSIPDATNDNTMIIRPARSKEDSEFLYFYLHMFLPSEDDLKISVNHGTVFVEARDVCGFVKYLSWIDLPDIDSPDKIYKTCDIKAEMSRGVLKLAIPKLKEDEKVYNVKVESLIDTD